MNLMLNVDCHRVPYFLLVEPSTATQIGRSETRNSQFLIFVSFSASYYFLFSRLGCPVNNQNGS